MRGAKRKIHFLPEFCKVISEPQWIYTAAHSHSSTFTASFLSRSASFEPCPFPSIICTAPKTAFPCSDHSDLWVQPAGQLIPHPQDKTRWHVPTSVQPSAQSRTWQLWITQDTWHCPQIFCFVSVPTRESSVCQAHANWHEIWCCFSSSKSHNQDFPPPQYHSLSSLQFCHLFTHQFHHLLHISSRVPCP